MCNFIFFRLFIFGFSIWLSILTANFHSALLFFKCTNFYSWEVENVERKSFKNDRKRRREKKREKERRREKGRERQKNITTNKILKSRMNEEKRIKKLVSYFHMLLNVEERSAFKMEYSLCIIVVVTRLWTCRCMCVCVSFFFLECNAFGSVSTVVSFRYTFSILSFLYFYIIHSIHSFSTYTFFISFFTYNIGVFYLFCSCRIFLPMVWETCEKSFLLERHISQLWRKKKNRVSGEHL